MFRINFTLLAAMFILLAGVVSAVVCGCNDCATCTDALNKETCTVVIADGSTFGPGADCITNPVNFSNKIFDLNGTIIDGSAGGFIGINLSNQENITVANGTISGFIYSGLYMYRVKNATIYNLTVNETQVSVSGYAAIYLGESNPLGAYSSNSRLYNLTVSHNNVTQNTPGIMIEHCHDNQIWESVSSANGIGLVISNGKNNSVWDFVADGNTHPTYGAGVLCAGTVGDGSVGNSFTRVNSSGNLLYGMYSYYCPNTSISDGTFEDNPEGLVISLNTAKDGHNFLVTGNTLSGNTENGIRVEDIAAATSLSLFSNNVISSPVGATGVYLNISKNNTFINNTIKGGRYGLIAREASNTVSINDTVFSASTMGFRLIDSDNINLSNTHIYNNHLGISIRNTSYYFSNILLDRTAGDYTDYANLTIIDQVKETASYTMNWTSNSSTLPNGTISFENKFVNISIVSGSPVIDQLIWHWQTSEEAGYFDAQFELWEYSGATWSNTGATLDTNANTLTINNLNPASDYGILQNLTKCPVITSSGAYQLQADLTGAPNAVSGPGALNFACVVIESDDVYIDCNGSTITNDGTARAAAVLVNGSSGNMRKNVTIENCPGMQDYEVGAFLYYLDGGLVRNSSVYNNSVVGILLQDSLSGSILKNDIYNNTRGVEVYTSENNTLAENRIYDNTDFGVYFTTEANSNGMIYNNISDNLDGLAIYNSSNNTFIENRMYGNQRNGLWVNQCLASSGAENKFYDNYYYDNNDGISIGDSAYAAFFGSTVRNNTAYGIWVGNSEDIMFASLNFGFFPNRDLVSELNGQDGFRAENSKNIVVAVLAPQQVYIQHNAWNGISLLSTTDSMIAGDASALLAIYNNSFAGINLINADDNNVSYVESYGNGNEGMLFFSGSDGNNVSYSSFHDNLRDGIDVTQGDNNILEHTTIANNTGSGLSGSIFNGLYAFNLHFYNNTDGDMDLGPVIGAQAIALENLIFDNPLGDMQNYTNLSIIDAFANGDGYVVNWTTNSTALPAGVTSFENKWVNISVGAGTPSIDEVVWHWTDAEALGYDENIFTLVKYNVSDGWAILNNTPDTAANTLSWYNFNPSSDYGILNYNASIVVEKTDLTSYPISQGGMAEFQLNITNNGNATLDPVSVVDTLPIELTFNATNTTPYSLAANTINWTIASIAPGESVIILLNATATTAGVYYNSLFAEGQPSLGTNVTNSTSIPVTVNASSISVIKQASRSSATIGQKVTFNFTIMNDGEVGLNPVIVQDTLPAQLSFTGEASISPDSIVGQVLTWDASVIPMPFAPGDTFFVEYNVTVVSTGSAQNNVTVEGEPNNGDNVTDTASVTLTTTKKPSSGKDDEYLDLKVPDEVPLGTTFPMYVTSDGSPVNGATIKIYAVDSLYWYPEGTTVSPNGEYSFTPAHIGTHRAYASEGGYVDSDNEYFEVTSPLEVECYTTSDCTDKYGDCYMCILGAAEAYNQCVLKPGAECGGKKGDECPALTDEAKKYICSDDLSDCFYAAGTVCIDCMCVPAECLTNADCPEGEQCIDYECTGGEEPPEEGTCETNADCAYDQYCSGGECLDLDCVCGYPEDHACVYYECCDNGTCEDLYGDNFYCNLDIHECEEITEIVPGDQPIDVDVPDETQVGEEVTITVTSDGDPVSGAEVTVVVNDLPYSAGITNLNGEVTFTPEEPGQYTVLVSKEGFASGEEEFKASSGGEGIWETIIRGVWILLFLLILLAIIYVLATRKKKRRPKEDMEE